MRIPVLQQIPVDAGPFVTVSLDVSRDDESAGRRIELNWRDHRRVLAESGVPDGLVEEIGERVEVPTGRPGSAGRLVVAGREAMLLDVVLPRRPVRDEVVVGPAPHLLPAFRALGDRVPYLLAEIDRTGADVTLVDEWGSQSGQVVEGDHDVIHKVPGGGVAHRRIQARVEDSWARHPQAP